MKTSVVPAACPKCLGSGVLFATDQRADRFSVSWTRCDCMSAVAIQVSTANQALSPVFL